MFSVEQTVYFRDVSICVSASSRSQEQKEIRSTEIVKTGYQIHRRHNNPSLKRKLVTAPCAAIRFQSHKNPFEPLVFPWLMPSLFQHWLFRAKQVLSCQMRLFCFHHPGVIHCVLLPLTRFWVAWIPGHADITASDLCISKLFWWEASEGRNSVEKNCFIPICRRPSKRSSTSLSRSAVEGCWCNASSASSTWLKWLSHSWVS